MSIRAFLHPASLGMGAHVARVRIERALRGHPRHRGSAEQVLHAGLEGCWSGRYLTASPGHYRQFWTRDLGFAAPALVRLGDPWPERLLRSLEWAIAIWRRRRSHVTTTINPLLGWPVDLFDFGVDSLPLLLASIQSLTRLDGRVADRVLDLVGAKRTWLTAEVEHYVRTVVDPSTGLVRTDRHFSAHRDTFRNRSTAYANTMVALLARMAAELNLRTPAVSRLGTPEEVSARLVEKFWLGDRFRDRVGSDETSGEANVWPFFAGVVEDPSMLDAALATLRREGYATPMPLRFDAAQTRSSELMLVFRLYSGDYQTTAAWTSLGSIYLSLLREVDGDAAQEGREAMRALIERDGTFWEVIDSRGRGWRSRSRLSVSDHSMLWGAILLETLLHPNGPPLRISR